MTQFCTRQTVTEAVVRYRRPDHGLTVGSNRFEEELHSMSDMKHKARANRGVANLSDLQDVKETQFSST